jgi:hypothetical protein
MNINEFIYGFHESASGKHHSKVSRHSRKEKITSCRVFVEDKTNGMKEEFSIPEGHYSKKEMQKLREDAVNILIGILLKKRKK